MVWYVAYRKGQATRLHVANNRAAAVEAALSLLDHVVVTEVGSHHGSEPKIGAGAIREIWYEQRGRSVLPADAIEETFPPIEPRLFIMR